MTYDDEQSAQIWETELHATLADAIAHLETVIFEDGWDALRTTTDSDEDALRESVLSYERELARLFGTLRASGALPSAVAWSTLKTELRRAALDAGTEISLRTALETGFYAAESVPLADHRDYLNWATAVRAFLSAQVRTDPPGPGATDEDYLLWAYDTLAALEERAAFNSAFSNWVSTSIAEASTVRATDQRLVDLPRFDLFLNIGLRWLATSHR